MDNQSNYIYPSRGCADEDVSRRRDTETAKQRTESWSLVCDGAKVITGSTLLGHWISAHWRDNRLFITKCTTAKEKLYHQICKSGLIMDLPTNHMYWRLVLVRQFQFFPGVTFGEHGSVVLQAGSWNYMKAKEDASGVTENDTDRVCFEFKGPRDTG